MPKRECLKIIRIGQSATKSRKGMCSTTSKTCVKYRHRTASDWQSEMVDYLLNIKTTWALTQNACSDGILPIIGI